MQFRVSQAACDWGTVTETKDAEEKASAAFDKCRKKWYSIWYIYLHCLNVVIIYSKKVAYGALFWVLVCSFCTLYISNIVETSRSTYNIYTYFYLLWMLESTAVQRYPCNPRYKASSKTDLEGKQKLVKSFAHPQCQSMSCQVFHRI